MLGSGWVGRNSSNLTKALELLQEALLAGHSRLEHAKDGWN
jgi:hypothetical protein